MFGRRRHAAAAVAPIVTIAPATAPLPRLAEERIFELVHARIAAAIGESGQWVVRRRTPDDTDELFRTVLAHQVALDVTAALRTAQLQLEAEQQSATSTGDGSDAAAAGAEQDATTDANDVLIPIVTPEHAPAHRNDDPDGDDDAVLDEDAVALKWEPAPITVWTDLKKPVTDPAGMLLPGAREAWVDTSDADLVARGR